MLYKTLSAPLTAQLEVTSKCNNRCPHCYNHWRQVDDPDTTLSDEGVEYVMGELRRSEIFRLTVTGGEPLLYPGKVATIVKHCAEGRIACSINSNLTTVTGDMIQELKNYGEFGFLTSIASFDSDIHDQLMGRSGAFDLTMRGIEALKEHNVRFSVNMVVSQANADQVFETGQFANSLGASFFAATKASPPLGCTDYSAIRPTEQQIRNSLYELLRLEEEVGIPTDILECYPLCYFSDIAKYEKFAKRSCSAGVTTSTIGSDGSVRPCSHSNRVYGNIFQDGLSSIYHRMTEWRTGELLPSTCRECRHVIRCSGGCRCEAEYYGEIDDMDPLATSPEQVMLPLKAPKKRVDIDDRVISVADNIRLRTEDFGCVMRRGRQTILLDEEAHSLVRLLFMKPATFEEIIGSLNCNERSCRGLLEKLVREEFLTLSD